MESLENFYVENNDKTLAAIQPLMIFASEKYYKKSVMRDGISHFFRFKLSKEMMDKVLVVPDGSIDIVFNVNEDKSKAFCYGSPLNLTDINFVPFVKESKEIFGVRLLPGNTIMPGGFNVGDFTNKGVDLSSVLNIDDDFIEEIGSCNDFNEQIRIFTNHYLAEYRKRVIDVKKNNLSAYLVERIVKAKGNIKIEDLSRELGYSTRYNNKLFNDTFGMSPKHFCKIMRFQGAIRAITGNEKITDIADDLGFFDQSHLGKEFKKFAGTSPKKFEEIINTAEYKERLILIK